MKSFKIALFLVVLTFLSVPQNASAECAQNKFISIVHPVRIAPYTTNSAASVSEQYKETTKRNLFATWLVTYDVLKNPQTVSVLKNMDEFQELGLFLEVGPQLATDSGVLYNDKGAWHYATNVFLSGYSQEDRIKLIDTLFELFKSEFGFYPKSVGSWWTDAYSLQYMNEKYGVIANLTVADQYGTDNYLLWGQYWGYPFIPSKNHAGIPARTQHDSIPVVMTQWAPRDPDDGYKSSLYSTQDYFVDKVGKDTSYLEKLISLYSCGEGNEYGFITVGLEGDLGNGSYSKGEYSNQLNLFQKLHGNSSFRFITMSEFAKWHLGNLSVSPPFVISSTSLKESGDGDDVYWYQSPNYRIGLRYSSDTNTTEVIDFRSYHPDYSEPYYLQPNDNLDLIVNIPFYIDTVSDPDSGWVVNTGKFKESFETSEEARFVFEDGEIQVRPSELSVQTAQLVDIPQAILKSKSLVIEKTPKSVKIKPVEMWEPTTLYEYRDLDLEATYFLRTKKAKVLIYGAVLVLAASTVILLKFNKDLKIIALLIIVSTAIFHRIHVAKSVPYFVSQDERAAALYLSTLDYGSILVYDKECPWCMYTTSNKPAVYAGKKGWLGEHTKFPLKYNKSFFEAQDLERAKREFKKMRPKYIFIDTYGEQEEKVPFSPGDFNIERIYKNAYVEIWKVKND